MKKISLLSILTTIVVFVANAQIVNVPDPVFKNFLVNYYYNSNPFGNANYVYLDANQDGEIQYSEAVSYLPGANYNYGFNLNNMGIADLTGIEAFQSIRYINVSYNPLTALTLSLSSLENLIVDNCSQLTSIDIHGSQNIKTFRCQLNANLVNLNIVGCWLLQDLRVNYNPLLTSLDLGIGYYYALTFFQCNGNSIISLDISKCTVLAQFYCYLNQLTSLNIANGHMNTFQSIWADGNPDLFCIQVDNVPVAEYLWGNDSYSFRFDLWATFNTNCTNFNPNCTIGIPNANFKNALLNNPAINTNGNNDIECEEAEAYTGAINVDGLNITNVTGIEAFVNLTSLSCNNNPINTLNVSGFTALSNIEVSTTLSTGVSVDLSNCASLTTLNLNNKKLNALNLNGCSALTNIDCANNLLSSLDVSYSPALTSLTCNNNQLTSLNTYNNPSLITLDCSNNQLPYLMVSLNAALTTLNCSNNNLTYLDVNNNELLTTLNCSHNTLSSISVNNNPVLMTFDGSNNNLISLNMSADTALINLNCSYNSLTNIDNISNNLNMKTLDCSNNNLASVNVSNNSELINLYCSHNQLTTLDVAQTPKLSTLVCTNNQLTSLNIANTAPTPFYLFQLLCTQNLLTSLDLSGIRNRILMCDSNQLEILNLANGFNTTYSFIYANDNPNLTCVEVDNDVYSSANWTNNPDDFLFDAGVIFSENCGTPTTGIDVITACESYTWIDGNTYTTNNSTATYTLVGGGTSGQDSIVTLHLTILHPSLSNIVQSICEGEAFSFNGALLSQEGVYHSTLQNAMLCDSVITLTLTVNSLPEVQISSSDSVVCAGTAITLSASGAETYTWSNGVSNDVAFVPESTDNYTVTAIDTNGCSKTIEQTIVVNPLPPVPIISAVGAELTSSSTSGNQWYFEGEPIAGATQQTHTTTQDGSYYVVVTDANGCSTQSDIFVFSTIGISSLSAKDGVRVYPNPTNGIVYFSKPINLHVINVLGEIIFHEKHATRIDLSRQAKGIYFISIVDNEEKIIQHIKIIKE